MDVEKEKTMKTTTFRVGPELDAEINNYIAQFERDFRAKLSYNEAVCSLISQGIVYYEKLSRNFIRPAE